MATETFTKQLIDLEQQLRAFAMSLTRDKADAEELIQETHYRAISNEDKFAKGTNIKAWLYTIMKNIFINNYRKQNRRKSIMNKINKRSFLTTSSTSEVENSAESSLVMEDLKSAVSSLDDKYRVPFKMHYEGYKYLEIADEMELHLGTVKSRIFFARKQLKEKLGSRLNFLN